ncbi:MAG: hypothetical protein ACXACY_24045 [Candidatus Hodarchaeales archaeon]|jgi:hypothetical protein
MGENGPKQAVSDSIKKGKAHTTRLISPIMLFNLSQTFWEDHIFDIIAVIFIPILIGLYYSIRWIYRKQKLRRTFSLKFPVRPYPSPHDSKFLKSKFIEMLIPGREKILLKIKLREALDIQSFEIRFIQNMWFATNWRKGINVSPDIIFIKDIIDRENRPFLNFYQESDRWGGIQCHYDPPNPKKKKESLWLEIEVDIKQSWKGLLSFRGYDKEGNQRHYRRFIEFFDPTQQGSDK